MVVTVQTGPFTAAAGDLVNGSSFGFDHLALIAAGRSRADGADFYLRHTSFGLVPMTFIFAGSAASYVVWNLPGPLGALATDAGYRLGFGDLGWTTRRENGIFGPTPNSVYAEYTVPALTLPPPSRTVPIRRRFGWNRLSGTLGRAFRRRQRHENEIDAVSMEWRDPRAEDWYEIRAFFASLRGAGAAATPAWLTAFGFVGDQVEPEGEIELEQRGPRRFYARAALRAVPS